MAEQASEKSEITIKIPFIEGALFDFQPISLIECTEVNGRIVDIRVTYGKKCQDWWIDRGEVYVDTRSLMNPMDGGGGHTTPELFANRVRELSGCISDLELKDRILTDLRVEEMERRDSRSRAESVLSISDGNFID